MNGNMWKKIWDGFGHEFHTVPFTSRAINAKECWISMCGWRQTSDTSERVVPWTACKAMKPIQSFQYLDQIVTLYDWSFFYDWFPLYFVVFFSLYLLQPVTYMIQGFITFESRQNIDRFLTPRPKVGKAVNATATSTNALIFSIYL